MNDLLVNGMLSDNGMTCVLDALVMPRSMVFWIWIMSSQVAPAQIVYPLTRVMIHLPNDQVRIDSASVVNMTRSDLTTHNPNPEYH